MYNVLIIGAGNKGSLSDAPGSGNEHKYLSYSHAVTDHPGFELSGYMDILPEMKHNAQKIWRVNNQPADVVVICTPDNSHYEYLLSALDMKPKLVICEKPLCDNSLEAAEIVDLYSGQAVPLMVDYTRRFIPEFQNIKQGLQSAGDFIEGFCYFNRGWEHTASHFIDTALWFNGNLDHITIKEIQTDYRWIYQWGLYYERDFCSECYGNPLKGYKVPEIFDGHLYYVMDNAYNFLRGKEKLYCTGEDGLRAIQETERRKYAGQS